MFRVTQNALRSFGVYHAPKATLPAFARFSGLQTHEQRPPVPVFYKQSKPLEPNPTKVIEEVTNLLKKGIYLFEEELEYKAGKACFEQAISTLEERLTDAQLKEHYKVHSEAYARLGDLLLSGLLKTRPVGRQYLLDALEMNPENEFASHSLCMHAYNQGTSVDPYANKPKP